jgi:hypothetical protein
MTTKILKSYNDIKDIEYELDKRNHILIQTATKYYPYILDIQEFKQLEEISTDFEPMITFIDGNDKVEKMAVDYSIHFYALDIDYIPFQQSEIILRVGVTKNDEKDFTLRSDTYWKKQEVYEYLGMSEYILHKSAYIERFSYLDLEGKTAYETLPEFYSKLSLKFYSPSFLL